MTSLKKVGLLKKWEKGSEILLWLGKAGFKPMGYLKNARGAVKFYSGCKWQNSNQ